MSGKPDFGEPWGAYGSSGPVYDRHGDAIGDFNLYGASRAAACASACAGMDDPAAEIAALRELIASVHNPDCPHRYAVIVGNCCQRNDEHLKAREMADIAALREDIKALGVVVAASYRINKPWTDATSRDVMQALDYIRERGLLEER